jgi:hypothetical protein
MYAVNHGSMSFITSSTYSYGVISPRFLRYGYGAMLVIGLPKQPNFPNSKEVASLA